MSENLSPRRLPRPYFAIIRIHRPWFHAQVSSLSLNNISASKRFTLLDMERSYRFKRRRDDQRGTMCTPLAWRLESRSCCIFGSESAVNTFVGRARTGASARSSSLSLTNGALDVRTNNGATSHFLSMSTDARQSSAYDRKRESGSCKLLVSLDLS